MNGCDKNKEDLTNSRNNVPWLVYLKACLSANVSEVVVFYVLLLHWWSYLYLIIHLLCAA